MDSVALDSFFFDLCMQCIIARQFRCDRLAFSLSSLRESDRLQKIRVLWRNRVIRRVHEATVFIRGVNRGKKIIDPRFFLRSLLNRGLDNHDFNNWRYCVSRQMLVNTTIYRRIQDDSRHRNVWRFIRSSLGFLFFFSSTKGCFCRGIEMKGEQSCKLLLYRPVHERRLAAANGSRWPPISPQFAYTPPFASAGTGERPI